MNFLKPLAKGLGRFVSLLRTLLNRLGCALINLRRRLFRGRLPDYVLFTLDRDIEERSPDRPFWRQFLPGDKPPITLESLGEALRQIAGDPDVRGVVLLLKSPALSLPKAQSLAALFERFRQWDVQLCGDREPALRKRVIVYVESASTPAYVAACAADQLYLTPLSDWDVLGFRSEPVFLKETLAKAGISFDAVKIAPWKTALDQFTRGDISEAAREQTSWLLDSLFDDVVSAIASGRRLDPAQVRELINHAPYTAKEARDHGLVDGVLYEDELLERLGQPEGEVDKPATLKRFGQTRGLLRRYPRQRARKAVGIISLQGAIVSGSSRSFPVPLPLLGSQQIGSSSAQQIIRAARDDDRLAAIVLHVDSPGGSALASDVMWRELKLLNQKKPLIIYMGDVAASGGYYIAAPGRHIVAQPATITGSIGVINGKPVDSGLYQKLDAHRDVIQRGDNAVLNSSMEPWRGEPRAKVELGIQHVYREFKQRVADGRGLAYDALEPICQGKVWTGKQALAHGLVDALGDLQTAVDIACEQAALPTNGSVRAVNVRAPDKPLLPRPHTENGDALAELAAALLAGDWTRLLGRERVWLLAGGWPEVK